MEKFEIVKIINNEEKVNIEDFSSEQARKIKSFHESFDQYERTPLAVYPNTAKEIGLKNFYVKDESKRFGLNAFKVLGGSYAMGKYIADLLKKDISEVDYAYLISDEVKDLLGDITFVTATDGNHGRGVAWTANQLRQKSIVFMPKGSAEERVRNIEKENSEVRVLDKNYDDAVREANSLAEENGYVIVQDTSWEGYEDIPLWIMQGYMTMALEAIEQIEEGKLEKPTHIFLQAGVGSMASAVTSTFRNYYKEDGPIITIVEPNAADPIYQTVKSNDGKIHNVTGDLNTFMAGLACGEPAVLGWKIINDYADFSVSVPDYVAARGMRILSSPIAGDQGIISGESGAGTFGFVSEVLRNDDLKDIREVLKLDENSVCLFFSTEGDTDSQMYRDIIWDGRYPTFK